MPAFARVRKTSAKSGPKFSIPRLSKSCQGALDQTLEDYYTTVFQRYEFRERMRVFFERYNLLASPTLPVLTFDVGLNVPPQIPDANIISWVASASPFNLTGYPAASVPAGFTGKALPVGFQIVGGSLQEAKIFAVVAAIEAARRWADNRPPI